MKKQKKKVLLAVLITCKFLLCLLDTYGLVFLFLHSIRGFLHIAHTCTCIVLCPL
jgi:hypothetical protein